MGRLIDADLLIDVIKNIQDHMREVNKKPVPVDAREIFTLFIEMVEKQSTAYDLEEVVKQLEAELIRADEEKERCSIENPLQFDSAKGYAHGIANAIEIVKGGFV